MPFLSPLWSLALFYVGLRSLARAVPSALPATLHFPSDLSAPSLLPQGSSLWPLLTSSHRTKYGFFHLLTQHSLSIWLVCHPAGSILTSMVSTQQYFWWWMDKWIVLYHTLHQAQYKGFHTLPPSLKFNPSQKTKIQIAMFLFPPQMTREMK